MTKKILAMLLSVAMLAAIVVVPGYAAVAVGDVACDENFTGVISSEEEQTLSSGVKLTGGEVKYGVSGKTSDDAAIDFANDGTLTLATFNPTAYSSTGLVIEFSFYKKTASGYTYLNVGGAQASPCFRESGTATQITGSVSGSYGTYELNRWNHVVIATTDFANGDYNVYLNGELLTANDRKLSYYLTNSAQRTVGINHGKSMIDDVKIYAGTYAVPTKPTLSSENSIITIDNDAKTISMPACAISELSSKIAASDGTISGVVDTDTYMTKTSGAVEDGDLIAVVANDGVTYSYYTVALLETYSHSENFETITDTTGTDNNYWYKVASTTNVPNQYIVGGEVFTGVGGKSATDKSLLTHEKYRSDHYYRFDIKLYGKTTLEYSMLNTDTSTNVGFGYRGSNYLINFGGSGLIYADGSQSKKQIGSYDTAKWYRVAYEFDFATGKYDGYINGERVVIQGDIPFDLTEGTFRELRFHGNQYLDNVTVYSGSYTGANTTMPTLSSGTGYTVNEATKTVVLNSEIEATSAATAVTFGSNVTVVDPETNLTKTEGSIEVGDLIAVVSDDGLFFTYYTVVPADGISDISIIKDGSAFAGDEILETGSYQASVHITATDVDRSDSYELIIAKYEGSTLTGINVKAITAAPAAGSFVDADFTTDAVTVSDADTESLKAYLWDASDLTPIKYVSIPVFTTPQ